MDKKSDFLLYIISAIKEKSDEYLENQLSRNGLNGLVGSHGSILFALYSNKGRLKLTDIARIIGRKKPTVTVLIDKLEKLDIVKREPSAEDARVTNVVLTDRGYEIRKIYYRIGRELLEKAYGGISEAEKENLTELLVKIAKNF